MQVWSRDPNSSRLTRSTLPPKPELKPDPVMAQPTSLQDRFYPIRTLLLSCIQLPSTGDNNFELKPQFINTLPKFHGFEFEDAYFFIREFEEVCLMMKISHLVDDVIRLRFVPFSEGLSQEMAIQHNGRFHYIVWWFHQDFLEEILSNLQERSH